MMQDRRGEAAEMTFERADPIRTLARSQIGGERAGRHGLAARGGPG